MSNGDSGYDVDKIYELMNGKIDYPPVDKNLEFKAVRHVVDNKV